ncbi:hypothetical protein QGP82_23695 [Leptothoe sp. LEGE 181152]|nr:hypothetical protein [Leptothoe sp. LEGE 181152]
MSKKRERRDNVFVVSARLKPDLHRALLGVPGATKSAKLTHLILLGLEAERQSQQKAA